MYTFSLKYLFCHFLLCIYLNLYAHVIVYYNFTLRDMGDQLTNDGQIDVDTVDEESGGLSFIMRTIPTYSASDKNVPTVAG